MRAGPRVILLGIAILLFLLALVLDENTIDLLLLGLIFFAASFMVDDLMGASTARGRSVTRPPGT